MIISFKRKKIFYTLNAELRARSPMNKYINIIGMQKFVEFCNYHSVLKNPIQKKCKFRVHTRFKNKEVCAWWNDLAKRFKICYIFVFQKHGKFWSIKHYLTSIEHCAINAYCINSLYFVAFFNYFWCLLILHCIVDEFPNKLHA